MTYRIYGFDECPWCQRAKALFMEEMVEFEEVTIETLELRTKWMDDRGFQAPKRTFPKIYVLKDGEEERLVGGFLDLEEEFFYGSDQ